MRTMTDSDPATLIITLLQIFLQLLAYLLGPLPNAGILSLLI
jgi:hypothetical protein